MARPIYFKEVCTAVIRYLGQEGIEMRKYFFNWRRYRLDDLADNLF
jgi:hypothetical protein